MGKIAPEIILRATLETLRWATVQCRTWTFNEDVSSKQINDLMDAIHEVPRILTDWDEGRLEEIRSHFAGYDNSKWDNSFNLSEYFDIQLKDQNQ